jgi:hypothetical protein
MLSAPITRESYREKRLRFVRGILDPKNCRGLEIGACDLATVGAGEGKCSFADFRSADEMSRLWNLPRETVMPVEFVVKRGQRLDEQIEPRFDYVVACHAIEHVPNPIGYLEELAGLLDSKKPSFIVLAVPDKRHTFDCTRSSTTLEHLLCDYYQNSRYPSIEHILDHGKHWSKDLRTLYESSASAYYRNVIQNYESGEADAHCHVWMDHEYFDQIRWLVSSGLLSGMKVLANEETPSGFNEFMVAIEVNRQ